MTFPEHIANAPTPRTDGYPLIKFEGCDAIAIAPEDLAQLERQLIWLTEVVEKLNLTSRHHYLCGWHAGCKCTCGMSEAYSALNEYKQGTKV